MAAANHQAGAKSDKIWRAAIQRAVNRREDGKGNPKWLDRLADKLVSVGGSGDVSALKEIGDRLDGKPAQAIVGDPERPLAGLGSLDMLELARRTVYLLDLANRQPVPERLEVLDVPTSVVESS